LIRTGGSVFAFGKRRQAAAAEAARRAERRAIFAELGRRPAHICPFLALGYERTAYVDGPSIEHRCFALGEPARLSAEQQTQVCQQRGHGQCPRYLRGLLATPSEELEALRSAGASEESTTPRRRRSRRGRGVGVLIAVVVIALGGAAAAAFFLGLVRV
jgi:hypothetical protein